jgi:hypothetical protein
MFLSPQGVVVSFKHPLDKGVFGRLEAVKVLKIALFLKFFGPIVLAKCPGVGL